MNGKTLLIIGALLTVINIVTLNLPWVKNVSAFDVTWGNWVALMCVYFNLDNKGER